MPSQLKQSFIAGWRAGGSRRCICSKAAETYLRDEALKRLMKAAVDEAVRDFNVTTISVGQGNLDEALAHARQMPMISPRRVWW